MNLETIPLAQRDIQDAAKYYRAQREGLDQELLAEVDAVADAIRQGPLRFEEVRPGVRRCLLDRFPYEI
jgi:plasmid stabilization system protein ParE